MTTTLYNIGTLDLTNEVTSLFRIKVNLHLQKAKLNLSIKVTKTFDQHDRCDQQIFKGVI